MKLFKNKKVVMLEEEIESLWLAFVELAEITEDSQASLRYYEALSEYLGDYIEDTYGDNAILVINEWEGHEEYQHD